MFFFEVENFLEYFYFLVFLVFFNFQAQLLFLVLFSVSGFTPYMDAQIFESVDAGRGAVTVQVSDNYVPGEAAQLLILLHGRAWDGDSMEGLFELTQEANNRGYIYCYPDGLATFTGVRYWNATNACCCQGFPFTSCEDDVGYLTNLISILKLIIHISKHGTYIR